MDVDLYEGALMLLDSSSISIANGFASLRPGRGPVLAIAAHNGHETRGDAASWILFNDVERFR